MKMELRVNPTSMETNDDGSLTVSGYVNRTEEESRMLGSKQKFKEVIKRGAWQKAVTEAREIHFLAEHDKSKILASTRNGSLELREDENGLYMEATISPTSWGRDYYQLIKDGILNNMSFGFRAVKDSWRNLGSHFERTVNELELFEVSVVRDPAYASSSISARGIDLVQDEVPDTEVNLRTIEIRNDADIEAIAKKLFEMITSNAKVAEGHEEETEAEEVGDSSNENDPDDKVEEKEPDQKDPEEKPEDKEEVDPEVKDDEVEKDEVVEDEEVKDPVKTEAEKIRDFITKFKTEE
jgi:HK97 family phage prohead protease